MTLSNVKADRSRDRQASEYIPYIDRTPPRNITNDTHGLFLVVPFSWESIMKREQVPGHEFGRVRGIQSEQRIDTRHLTVYRVAMVRTAGDVGLWRVKNMSDRGMLLESGATVVPNDKLEVALSETILVSGRVVWSGGEQCGIAFDKPIDAGDILRQLAAERESDGYRPLRLQVRVPAKLLVDTEERKIIVSSLSQRGAGFAYEGELREAAQVSLALPDGAWRQGNIRWLRNGQCGPLPRVGLCPV